MTDIRDEAREGFEAVLRFVNLVSLGGESFAQHPADGAFVVGN